MLAEAKLSQPASPSVAGDRTCFKPRNLEKQQALQQSEREAKLAVGHFFPATTAHSGGGSRSNFNSP